MALDKALIVGVFRGISIGDIEISHLLYVEDVVILSPWSLHDVTHILRILRCFFLVSGLKINLHKSRCINYMGYFYEYLPFIHLGVPMGQNMN